MTATKQQVISILLSATLLCSETGFALGQEGTRSDSLLEAARYLQRAEEDMNCSTADARKWADVASDKLSQYRAASQSERDTAAMLRVRITFLRNDIEVRQKTLKQAASETERLVTAKRLSSAQPVIQTIQTTTPTCDPRFRQWESTVSRGLAEADRLVQAGDERMSINPREARHLYEAALAINIEQPDVLRRIASAQEASRHGHPVLKKVVWTTVVIALAGGAAYAANEYYKRQREAATSRGSKPTATIGLPR